MTAAELLACGFRGRAIAMQVADVAAAAKGSWCEPAIFSALLDVESSGHGFDATGRPKMLPERHIFYRRLAGTPMQAQAVAAHLAYPAQGTLPYPVGPDACYALLAQMMALAPDAALQSCSWGIAQVMGFNYAVGGYETVAAMVTDCLDSEAKQFALMVSYLQRNNLLEALRRRDFLAVANGYNGRGAAPAYAAKLQAAYAHHAAARAPAPKLAAPALARPPLHPDQLSCPSWLAVRAGQAADALNEASVTDALNAAELDRHRGDFQ